MALIGAFLAFLITVLFMFVLRPMSVAVGLVDIRKGHKRNGEPVPVIGGLAMCLGLGFVSGLIDHSEIWYPIVLAMALLVIVGTIDDRFDLPASVRFIAQTCAALLVVVGGNIMVVDLGQSFFFGLELGIFSTPFSLLFIVTIINAFNVVDGIDGLAGGLSFLSLVALATLGIGSEMFVFAVMVAAVVAAYLLFNLPLGFNRSVRSFMGDAGSTFLGVAIAVIGIIMCQSEPARFTPVIGLWLVAVPVFDLFSAAIRRVVESKSPFAPDHEHLHHVLIQNGLSPRSTLIFMLFWGILFTIVGLLGHAMQVPEGVMLIIWFGALVLYYQMMRRPKQVIQMVYSLKTVFHQQPT
ncbi:MAG: undecaprenyl/decaprenyl-phosphate alpha-N-acetylglucosaminyl 1-phosphate transferase [Gammaproteobacteria bacterium]|nr:undecaprenyl/decaprenyl-phosphate alpha-N-acetylglucosaminyl 1-phosphate transferase [Gammaproteobacteria bacterium]